MGTVETVFAVVVTVLAAACVILALVVAAYWLAVQARRLRAQLRRPDPMFWRDRGATSVPTIPRAEGVLIRQHARRILNGETIRGLAHGRKWS